MRDQSDDTSHHGPLLYAQRHITVLKCVECVLSALVIMVQSARVDVDSSSKYFLLNSVILANRIPFFHCACLNEMVSIFFFFFFLLRS